MRYGRAGSGPRPGPARAGRGGRHARRGLPGDEVRQVCGPLEVRPAGAACCTGPVRSAWAAPDCPAVSWKRIAWPRPGGAGAGKVARPDGMGPRPVSGWRNRTSSAAITMPAAGAGSIGTGARDAVDRHHRRLGLRVGPGPGRVEAVRAGRRRRAVPGRRRVRSVSSGLPWRCPAAPGRRRRHRAARRSWSRSFAPGDMFLTVRGGRGCHRVVTGAGGRTRRSPAGRGPAGGLVPRRSGSPGTAGRRRGGRRGRASGSRPWAGGRRGPAWPGSGPAARPGGRGRRVRHCGRTSAGIEVR
jgi:hypothetical protein